MCSAGDKRSHAMFYRVNACPTWQGVCFLFDLEKVLTVLLTARHFSCKHWGVRSCGAAALNYSNPRLWNVAMSLSVCMRLMYRELSAPKDCVLLDPRTYYFSLAFSTEQSSAETSVWTAHFCCCDCTPRTFHVLSWSFVNADSHCSLSFPIKHYSEHVEHSLQLK